MGEKAGDADAPQRDRRSHARLRPQPHLEAGSARHRSQDRRRRWFAHLYAQVGTSATKWTTLEHSTKRQQRGQGLPCGHLSRRLSAPPPDFCRGTAGETPRTLVWGNFCQGGGPRVLSTFLSPVSLFDMVVPFLRPDPTSE